MMRMLYSAVLVVHLHQTLLSFAAVAAAAAAAVLSNGGASFDHAYHDNAALERSLRELSSAFPNKTYLYSLGKSVEHRNIWVLAVADTSAHKHVLLRPEFKLVGNNHGNEAITGEVLLAFVHYLLLNQASDANADAILKSVRLHVLFSMNPDGVARSAAAFSANSSAALTASNSSCASKIGRNNSNNFDLNRNFPDAYFCNEAPLQLETLAVIGWLQKNQFVLSAALHTGALVTSYGYDNFADSAGAKSGKVNPADDSDIMRHLARAYSRNHATMLTETCEGDETFVDGVVNGAAWFPPVRGGMQDYNYWRWGCVEITMEIGCCFNPPPSAVPAYWRQNQPALLAFLREAARTGVRGIVRYANGRAAMHVPMQIDAREPLIKTSHHGEYFRLLVPGTYRLAVLLECGKRIYETNITLDAAADTPLVFNITLDDRWYNQSLAYPMDHNAVFCSATKSPVKCKVEQSNRNAAVGAVEFADPAVMSLVGLCYALCSLMMPFKLAK